MHFWHYARDDNQVISDAKKCQHGIYVPLRHGRKHLVEVLEHEPVFHPMVQEGLDIILQPLPRLGDGF